MQVASRAKTVTPVGYVVDMICLACTAPTNGAICVVCVARLRKAPDTVIGDGLRVIAAHTHEGPSRALVHALKYRGVSAAALPFVTRLAERIPSSTTTLVPVPRAWFRAARYGVDPAAVLAAGVARLTGLPVIPALVPPLWWSRHAGAGRQDRGRIGFRQRAATPAGFALVDDVVTTGATANAAADALDERPSLVLAATVAPRIRCG